MTLTRPREGKSLCVPMASQLVVLPWVTPHHGMLRTSLSHKHSPSSPGTTRSIPTAGSRSRTGAQDTFEAALLATHSQHEEAPWRCCWDQGQGSPREQGNHLETSFCFSYKPALHLLLLRAECGNHQQRGRSESQEMVSWMPGAFIAAMDHGGVCKVVPRITSRIKNQPQMLGNGLRPEPGRKQASAEGPWDLMCLKTLVMNTELALGLRHRNAGSSLAVPIAPSGGMLRGPGFQGGGGRGSAHPSGQAKGECSQVGDGARQWVLLPVVLPLSRGLPEPQRRR